MQEQKDKKKLMNRLKHTYRLIIMNNETFEEVGSYRLSLLNVYILLSTIIVLVAIIVGSVIFFTPVKRYIPGFGELQEHSELYRLNKTIEKLEEQLNAQRAYSDNFRRILVGNLEYTPEEEEASAETDSLIFVDRILEDEKLRKEIELDEIESDAFLLSRTVNFSPREKPLEQLYFFPPLTGEVSAEYMPEKKHLGVDIMAPKNTPVKAIMDGYVITSDWTLETGNTIGIQHENNLISFYKHNSALLKESGSFVRAGEAVAIIGNTGTLSTGPHLHFELWHNGKPLNPSEYINFY